MKMEPVFICLKEAFLNDGNKFTLDFSDEEIVHEALFSPKNDYYVTSMNCDLKLIRDLNAHRDILDNIKELSDKSPLLLEKGPTYQNDIKDMKLYIGVPGTFTHVPVYLSICQMLKFRTFHIIIDIMI